MKGLWWVTILFLSMFFVVGLAEKALSQRKMRETKPLGLGVAITCFGKVATIVGTPGDDKLTGTYGDDVINGLGGNDSIYGYLGNDLICGGDGDDKLQGGDTGNKLDGGPGFDECVVSGGGVINCEKCISPVTFQTISCEKNEGSPSNYKLQAK